MSGHKIDAAFIGKLTEARIAAHKEVETNTCYGHTPEARMVNFSAGIENGLGGDVGKFLGMLDPEKVRLILDELVIRRSRMRNIRSMADYNLGGEPEDSALSIMSLRSMLESMPKSPGAMMIPNPDVKLFQVGDQWVGIDDFTEVRNVLGGWLESSVETENVKWRRLTLGGLAREVVERFDEREANLRSGDALVRGQRDTYRSEVEHQKELVETYKEAAETSNEAAKTSAETTKTLLNERDEIFTIMCAWETAYTGTNDQDSVALPHRITRLINGYGGLNEALAKARVTLKEQNDLLEETRNENLIELIREIDVLGAYLRQPSEDRLETIKAALTKIEEQDELIGTLQRALVAAQSGQPRRPTGMREEPEKATGSESQPLATWFEKMFKDLYGATDLERMPKLNGPLDEMLRRLFEK